MQKPEKVQKEEIHHYDQSEMKIPIIWYFLVCLYKIMLYNHKKLSLIISQLQPQSFFDSWWCYFGFVYSIVLSITWADIIFHRLIILPGWVLYIFGDVLFVVWMRIIAFVLVATTSTICLTAFVAKLILASTGHVIASLIFLDPKSTFWTLFILRAFCKFDESFVMLW